MRPSGKTEVSIRADATSDTTIGLRRGKPTVHVEAAAATIFSAKADGNVVEISFKGKGLWGKGRMTRDMASRLITQLLEATEISAQSEGVDSWYERMK